MGAGASAQGGQPNSSNSDDVNGGGVPSQEHEQKVDDDQTGAAASSSSSSSSINSPNPRSQKIGSNGTSPVASPTKSDIKCDYQVKLRAVANNADLKAAMTNCSDPDNRIILRISKESLDFIDIKKGVPIIQFPYQSIICWGSSSQIFQFNVIKKSEDSGDRGVPITVDTSDGKLIETVLMKIIRGLMADMERQAMTVAEFNQLMSILFDKEGNLVDSWMRFIDQFTSSRSFIAKQAMELIAAVGDKAPFDKIDMICLVYDRSLYKDTFQLVVNVIEDKQEKENIIRLLNLEKKMEKNTNTKLVHQSSVISNL